MKNLLSKLLLILIVMGNHSVVFSSTFEEKANAEKMAVRNVILAMNQAVTEQSLEGVLAAFETNALKVDVFPDKYKKSETSVLPRTEKQEKIWKNVFIIIPNLKAYERIPASIMIQIDGNMASAWVNIKTRAVYKNLDKMEQVKSFYELVLLRKIAGQWKIMLTSNNRHDTFRQ